MIGTGAPTVPRWVAAGLDPALEAARRDARATLDAALSAGTAPEGANPVLWATAELSARACLELALDRYYASAGLTRPPPRDLLDDLRARQPMAARLLCQILNAPDTRACYVFLEDFLTLLGDGSGAP